MPEHIKNVIEKFLKEIQNRKGETERITQVIKNVLGESEAAHISLKKIYQKKVLFSVDSSSFSYDFNLKKQKVLVAIKKEFPYIEDIIIRIG